jgi:phosphoribosylglycinamide formyltransferase-1
MRALLDACRAPSFPVEIALVISNRPDAAGLEFARDEGVEARIIDHTTFGKGVAGRRAFEHALDQALRSANIELVALGGFMRLLGADFVDAWRGRLINIHPSLLPDYKGLDVHQRMIDDGARFAGCTVHYVEAEMDAGPIIGQAALMIAPGEDAATLAARTLALEHRLYPECLKRAALALN